MKKYKTDTTSLNKNELEVLAKLIEASKLVAKIYKLQLDSKGKPNFYPPDATKKEVEKAAVHDPALLSPYTVVERDKEGKLTAIPYHVKYREYLILVSKKLEEAAKLTVNQEFSHALMIQAKVLLNGKYEEAQITWVKIKPYVINIVIGPIERIEDNLFFVKRSYQAWVGLMQKRLTERFIDFKDAAFVARRRMYSPSEKVEFMQKAQFRIDQVVIFTGLMARYKFTATTLPNDIDILEKHGSEATIFLENVQQQFHSRHLAIFNTIFAANFRQAYSEEELYRGYLYTVMLHEIARVLVRYRFAYRRLQEYYPIFNELTVEVLAIKLSGSLLLKDVLSQKEMESILVMFLTRIFDYYLESKNNSALEFYVLGNAVLLNSLVSSGALVITKAGISWPNFTKMFIAVSNIAEEIEKVLAEGNYNDAKHYLEKHSSLTIFKQFSSALNVLRKS